MHAVAHLAAPKRHSGGAENYTRSVLHFKHHVKDVDSAFGADDRVPKDDDRLRMSTALF